MKENKDQPRTVSTCFEGSPGAEILRKIMGEEGIGSLCEEMMRLSANGSRERKEGSQKGPKKEGSVEEKSDRGSEAVKSKNENRNHGGLK